MTPAASPARAAVRPAQHEQVIAERRQRLAESASTRSRVRRRFGVQYSIAMPFGT